MMVVAVVGVEHQLIVAAIAESGPYHSPFILAPFSVKRNHHLAMGSVRIAHTVFILYHLHAVGKGGLLKFTLVGP